MEIQWMPSAHATYLYTAAARIRGIPFADFPAAVDFGKAADDFASEIRAAGLDPRPVLTWLVALAGQMDDKRLLVQTALRKAVGPKANANHTAHILEAMNDLYRAGAESIDGCQDQLQLRKAVMREQWEAYGPGLLHAIGRRTESDLIASRGAVLLVFPVLGGGGEAYLLTNSVSLEAVLANPYDDLPEVVRLAWLLAQLNLEAPIFSETVHGERLPRVAAIAMLPATLQAAEELQLSQYSESAVRDALLRWRVDVEDTSEISRAAFNWWESYQQSRPGWSVAMGALDQMLGELL